MDPLSVISVVISSSVVVKLIDIFYSSYKLKKDEDKERQRELYSQLNFYLKLFTINKKTREELMEDNQKSFKEKTLHIQDQHVKGDLIMKNLSDSRDFVSKLIEDSWVYIESIKKLLEKSPKYIRENDWPIVEKFFEEYLKRDIVTGKEKYKDTSNLFTSEKIGESFQAIFNVIEQMSNKFKSSK